VKARAELERKAEQRSQMGADLPDHLDGTLKTSVDYEHKVAS
jgi:hypothetical protein